MEKVRSFFRCHPILADTLRWALPAIVFGAVLRILFTSYRPFAFWGDDSRSYYVFAHRWFLNGAISLPEKRRYLYPILMVPASWFPGGPLRWLPFFQHLFGLSTLLPLAYVIRKTLVLWRVWIVPVTVIYAGLPIVVWCEHELLADHLFFATILWAFGGWVAWVGQEHKDRARRLFWIFFVSFTAFILTKPAGRVVWPGLIVGFCMVKAWRTLTWKHFAALLVLLVITPTVGSKKHGSWLLLDATLPLVRLDTPLHAEYKAEIREMVEKYRSKIEYYHAYQDKEPFYLFRDPGGQDTYPLWKALGDNDKLRNKIYMDLALEGVKSRPDLFLYLGWQRVVFDANVSAYGVNHFDDGELIERSEEFYKEAEEDPKSPLRLAWGLPRQGPIAPFSDFQKRLEPAPGSWAARTVRACVGAYGKKLDFVSFPNVPKQERKLSLVRPTFLGVWLVAGIFLSLLPRYFRTLGVWAVVATGYLFAVYLISLVNVHYIAPSWPVWFVLLAVPGDAIYAALRGRSARAPGSFS